MSWNVKNITSETETAASFVQMCSHITSATRPSSRSGGSCHPQRSWGTVNKTDTIGINYETVKPTSNIVIFFQSTHKRHTIARPWGRGMGCPSWVHGQIYFLHLPLTHHNIMLVPTMLLGVSLHRLGSKLGILQYADGPLLEDQY